MSLCYVELYRGSVTYYFSNYILGWYSDFFISVKYIRKSDLVLLNLGVF